MLSRESFFLFKLGGSSKRAGLVSSDSEKPGLRYPSPIYVRCYDLSGLSTI